MEQKTAEDKIIEVFKKYSKSVDTEYNVYNCLIEEDWSNIAQGVVKLLRWMQEQDKWISCDLKPEKEFIDILLLFENECACSGYYVKEYDVFMPHSVMYRGLTVTHWKPFTLTSIQ